MLANGISCDSAFEKLVAFIEEFKETTDSEDAFQFMSIKKNRELGEYVTFKNYVGLIELDGGLQIEVLPKIDVRLEEDGKDGDRKIKQIFLNMLKTMKDFEGKAFNMSNLKVDNMNLYEIFISLYLQEVYCVVKRGLKSAYNTIDENISVLKGKIKFKEHIAKNITSKDKFYVEHDEYLLNRPENRLIKNTLLLLVKESNNNNNKKKCKQLLNYFETIDISHNIDADFAAISISRSNKEYDTLMRWSKVYLQHKSFDTFTGQTKAKALLFQMDKLFETYVAKLLRDAMEDTHYDVLTQDEGYYLFDEPEKFKLIPDIVVSDNSHNIILDTKWKNLNSNERHNYGISQADMYQMYTYSKKYDNAPVIYLLYPLNKDMAELKEDLSFKSEDNVTVNVFFVDLENPVISIDELKSKLV
ncbi:MAG: restriction endonuclease [Clostridiales bacterium]|nr:restriction endonuclease [Clostridiales bacterium]